MKSLAKMTKKEFLLTLVKDQVQPALGCTEIGIVSLAAAKAASLLPGKFKFATLYVSNYVYRNDARVGVPRLGRCGMKAIAAAGLLLKNPQKKLACLDDLTKSTIKQALEIGEQMNRTIEVVVEKDVDPVYTRMVVVDDKKNTAEVIIKYMHDKIVSAKLNGNETIKTVESIPTKTETKKTESFDNYVDKLTIEDAYNICTKLELNEIKFIQEGIDMNQKVVEDGINNPDKDSMIHAFNNYGPDEEGFFGFNREHWMNQILYCVTAAVDARMYGCPLPVMTSSRSGDHGLTVTIPQAVYAKLHNIDKLTLYRAITFSHFVTWKFKSKTGHLSGMCGSAVAAGAAACGGIGFQRKWNYKKINDLLNLHFIAQAGTICDGAKPSCTHKILNSLICGFMALIVVEGKGYLENMPGVSDDYIDAAIENVAKFSRKTKDSMVNNVVDILDRMSKCN